ncbi:MAG: glycogen/starch/alpha-glucan phosphorylase [Thermotaleaceae bacterium]
MERERFQDIFIKILRSNWGKSLEKATEQEKYYALVKAILDYIQEDWQAAEEAYAEGKQAYYFSAEFLMGRACRNNLINLGIYEDVKRTLEAIGIDLSSLEKVEEDAGLGNGGLGRLAACFLDSCATMNLPVTGYGIRYRHGLFRQLLKDGFQIETADTWLKQEDPWSLRREEDSVMVAFGDEKVRAIPYDMPIIGYDTKNVNKLRLWEAEPIEEFDFYLFNEQKYDHAIRAKNRAEDISRVLYPNDSKREGKILRLKQQYFFVSASLQDMVKKFKKTHGNRLEVFHRYHRIQLNDTHPVVAIPELMRILVNEEKMEWKNAWDIVVETFAYTNHTILAEALEQWDTSLYSKILPEIYQIIREIDNQFVKQLRRKGYEQGKIQEMRIISKNRIRMAWLAIHGAATTNGVAALHTKLLKEQELADWYGLYPNRFQNKTNGITPRRWLLSCNQELSAFITELIGTKEWVTNLIMLKELEQYSEDKDVLKKFMAIKAMKKKQLAEYMDCHEGIKINPCSIFDIQIKRLHEYKRQLLNAFHILDLYYRLKENPDMDIYPRTFIFGAKAAPGYFRAKAIIKYINEIANLINEDPHTRQKIQVVFIQNYGVSYAEKLFPAADVSEQISTAGKEASGTGNMKFMLNGTPTLGTYDGANVEIVEEAGEENNFIFGARVEELEKLKESYNPIDYYEQVPGLKRVIDSLIDGTFDDGNTGMFRELYDSILKGTSWHQPDNYFICKDFDSYRRTQESIDKAYRDNFAWAKKCWMNLANAGKFSTDRTIGEYAEEIWHIRPIKL